MAARDEGRALAAIQQLKDEEIGDGSVHWLNLNLSNPRLAKKAGDEFLKLEKRLDILGESPVNRLPYPTLSQEFGSQ